MKKIHEEGWDDDETFYPCWLIYTKPEIRSNDKPYCGIELDPELDEDYGEQIQIIESTGLWASGYTWEVLIEHYVQSRNPALAEEVNFDSEGSTFACSLDSTEKQSELAGIILTFLKDKNAIRRLETKIAKDPEYEWLKS
jgi:hypothetical protein